MKKYNLLIILCSLFIYTNTFAQQDTQFEFEFELVIDQNNNSDDDDDGQDDDDNSQGREDNGDDSDDDSEDNDDDSDDDSEDNDDDSDDDSEDNDDGSDDDNDNGNGKNGNREKNDDDELSSSLRADVILTNTGDISLTDDITFLVHVGTTEPETLPTEYDTEHIVTFQPKLSSGKTKNFSILIPDSSIQAGIDNIVTIWPLAESEDNFGGEKSNPPHYVYRTVFVPKSDNGNKEETDLTSKISVYPNPANGIVQIEILNDHTANQISIYNMSGQPIKTFERTFDLTTLDLKGLLSGIYFVAIKNERRQIIHYSKLVFHR